MDILLRTIDTIEELEKVAELEQSVWGTSPVPLHQTLTAAKNGGSVIGAFLEKRLVGFVYGFPGFKNGEVYLCSHMMGIEQSFRNQGIGYRLKMRQAEEALKLGYGKIRWTYDPLESRNGRLNIAKLGAICAEYIENCYGEMNDTLNKNMPSDRFNVEWWIGSSYLEERHRLSEEINVIPEQIVLDWKIRDNGYPEAIVKANHIDEFLHSRFLFVPVPLQSQEMKKEDHSLALDWRFKTRDVFVKLFAEGWAVFHVVAKKDEPVQYYVLAKKDSLSLT